MRELPIKDSNELLPYASSIYQKTWSQLGAITIEGQTEAGQQAEIEIATSISELIEARLKSEDLEDD